MSLGRKEARAGCTNEQVTAVGRWPPARGGHLADWVANAFVSARKRGNKQGTCHPFPVSLAEVLALLTCPRPWTSAVCTLQETPRQRSTDPCRVRLPVRGCGTRAGEGGICYSSQVYPFSFK